MNNNDRKHFWHDGLSIDETRVSALVICLFFAFIWGFISHFKFKVVDLSIVNIINTLILAITGVNVVNSLNIGKLSSNKTDTTSNKDNE